MEYLFGVDIGGTTVKIGLVSMDGQILDKFEIPTNKEDDGEKILPDVRDAIYAYLAKHNIEHNAIKGIGFGVPGPVSANKVFKCVNLGWGIKDVSEEFAALLDFKPIIRCGNDANVAALGEMAACKKYQNAVMFTLGTGVGGGIIYNGKPIDGVHGAGGELGHLRLAANHNYQCNCGLRGCLETVASATGVVRLAKEYLPNYPQSLLNGQSDLSCKNVFDAAKQEDELALKVVDEVAYYIGLAASIVASVVDPEVFIIGGGVSKAGSILTSRIEAYYTKFAFHAVRKTNFILASLGNDGGMLGAALLTRD